MQSMKVVVLERFYDTLGSVEKGLNNTSLQWLRINTVILPTEPDTT